MRKWKPKDYTRAVLNRLVRKAMALHKDTQSVSHLCPRAYCIAKPGAWFAVFVVPPRDREPYVKNDPYVVVQNETATPVKLGDWCAVAYTYRPGCGQSVVIERIGG